MYATLTPLGEQVQKICNDRGIKLGYVAAKMGLPDSSLSRILHGHRPEPRWSAMIMMADALGVSLDELAGRKAPRAPSYAGAQMFGEHQEKGEAKHGHVC